MAFKTFNRLVTPKPVKLKESAVPSHMERVVNTLHKAAGSLGDSQSDIWGLKVNSDNSLSVEGRLRLVSEDDEIEKELLDELIENGKLTIKFHEITGGIQLHDIRIMSLHGMPDVVDGYCQIIDVPITNFVGGPKKITQSLSVYSCPNLTSLEGFPAEIYGNCTLKSLPKLTTLKKSTPTKMLGNNVVLSFVDCGLTSLNNINKAFPEINGVIRLNYTQVKGGMLSLLEIKNLKSIEMEGHSNTQATQAIEIINKYLQKPNPKSHMVDCSNELEEAGLDEFADL